jgi:hypothetical protein
MNKLIDATDIARRDKKSGVREWLMETSVLKMSQRGGDVCWDGSVDGEPVDVLVNKGRVLARCGVCGGYEYVCKAEPIFFCLSCANNGSAAAKPVRFPDDWDRIERALIARPILPGYGRNEIEAVLSSRPVIRNLTRTWTPGKSAEQLEAENREGGLS